MTKLKPGVKLKKGVVLKKETPKRPYQERRNESNKVRYRTMTA